MFYIIVNDNRQFVKTFKHRGINGKKAAIIRGMRRFIILFGALLVAFGLRLYNNGLLNCGYDGELSHGTFDTVVYESPPFLIDGPHRMDIEGDERTALNVIDNLSGKLLWREENEDMKVFYAYSPRLKDDIKVHDKKVNLMISVSKNKVSIGTPLLYGSY